jgi:Spy/CpxP family protein refolding chaperone
MNKRIWLASLMAGALVGSALTVFADEAQTQLGDNGGQAATDQAQPAGDNASQGGDEGGHDGWGGGHSGMGMEKMKHKLGLTDDQVTQMKALFKSQMDSGKTLRDQMKVDMDILRQKVDAKASNSDLKSALDTLSADKKALDKSRQKMEDQVRQILTPMQQAKWVLSMQERGGQMIKNWMKHRKDGIDKDGDNAGGDSGNGSAGN